MKTCAIVALLAVIVTSFQSQVVWEPFELAMARGTKVPAEVGRLVVPESRQGTSNRKIEIGFVRLRARNLEHRDPLVYLDGGPGGTGYGAATVPDYSDLFERVRETRDVILPSQRGVGLSSPRLTCPPVGPLRDDFFLSADTMRGGIYTRLKPCAGSWREKGIELSAYNTSESAADLEDLRRALGVEKLTLFAFSYGTHLALETLRRFPQSIERAVLVGTEGPWHTWKLPSGQDAQFRRLAQASGSDLVSIWRSLLQKTAKVPLTVKMDSKQTGPRSLLLGPGGLQWLVRFDISDTNDWPMLAAMIVEAERGDTTLLGQLVARRFAALSGGGSLMGYAVNCASGASTERVAQIVREESSALLGPMTDFPYPEVCADLELPSLPESFRSPFSSGVPTLFVSGTNDGNTPPSQAEEVASRFSKASHIIVHHAGHESTLTAEVRNAMMTFLSGKDVPSQRVNAAAPKGINQR